MSGLYSPINRLAESITRPKGTGAEYMTELQKKPGYKPAEAEDRDLQALMALPQMERAAFMEKLKSQANKFPLKMRELGQGQTHHDQYTLPGGENYREILLHTPMPEGQGFEGRSHHFGGMPNILASIRVKDRTSPEGKKILHLEEIQSDWHQQGREAGYQPKDLDKQIKEAFKDKSHLTYALRHGGHGMDKYEYAEAQQALEEADNELNRLDQLKEEGVPYGPHAKDWHELALKAMIQHAAENGYDQIAVTPGAEQAKRFSLSKQVDQVLAAKEDGGLRIFARDKQGKNHDLGVHAPDQLHGVVGQDLAKRIVGQSKPTDIYQGVDLDIGGEGMKGFYDKMVPTFLNKFGKKHGVQVQQATLPQPQIENRNKLLSQFGVEGEAAQQPRLHTFDITPAMREDVLKNGIPRYDEGGIIHKAEGGSMNLTTDQMRAALMGKSNTTSLSNLQSVGANEAPSLPVKSFIPPHGAQTNGSIPVGGVDENVMQPGQQMMPQQPQQPGQPQPGQPQAQPQQGQPQPPQGPQSNILSITPQGQAMAAMRPAGMATGGGVHGYAGGDGVTRRDQTVSNPQRMAYSGIYKRPDVIASEAAARVAPEDPILKQLFGVTRADMYEQANNRLGSPHLGKLPGAAADPQGTDPATNVMTKRNEQRLLDVLDEAKNHESLVHGMEPWYYMDPLFQHMVRLLGMEKAIQEFKKMNALGGMASSASEVNAEIPRGSLAYYLQNQGRFNEFVEHGGERDPNRPADFGETPGHIAHKTAHALPMQKFLTRGEVDMGSPKVPMYIEASGVPETGFQTTMPVGDAHWSRAVGLADTRNKKMRKGKEVTPGQSGSNAEMAVLGPWWQHKIAHKMGLQSVPAQALAWGAFSPQTGVTTPIGAPKLELIAQQIRHTANRLGVSPETARDLVLTGKERMGKKKGGGVKLHTDQDTMALELSRKQKVK